MHILHILFATAQQGGGAAGDSRWAPIVVRLLWPLLAFLPAAPPARPHAGLLHIIATHLGGVRGDAQLPRTPSVTQVMQKSQQPPDPQSPPPSAHPRRWASHDQPAVVANPKGTAQKKFYCVALVGRMGTGKAAAIKIEEKSGKIFGPNEEEVLMRRERFIREYLHPRPPKQKRPRSPAESSTLQLDEEPKAERPRRSAAPRTLSELRGPAGAPRGSAGGPGRGHTFEYKAPCQQEVLPSVPAASANWFEQLQLKQQWKTARMDQLEAQLSMAVATVEQQKATILALRARVSSAPIYKRIFMLIDNRSTVCSLTGVVVAFRWRSSRTYSKSQPRR